MKMEEEDPLKFQLISIRYLTDDGRHSYETNEPFTEYELFVREEIRSVDLLLDGIKFASGVETVMTFDCYITIVDGVRFESLIPEHILKEEVRNLVDGKTKIADLIDLVRL